LRGTDAIPIIALERIGRAERISEAGSFVTVVRAFISTITTEGRLDTKPIITLELISLAIFIG
jgi:hypothetical protein